MLDVLQLEANCLVQHTEQQQQRGVICTEELFLWDVAAAYLDGLAEAPDGPVLHRRD